ncbi:hypothetical protein, partial [Acinetobacter sp. YH12219]|uniref:hypothetical protein n=1 Tax=Acinetobacter sp. YH12219 TaxID=2601153 RepID=UPI001C556176
DEIRYSDVTKPESFIVEVFVSTYILTILDSGFLFKSNYGTAVASRSLFMLLNSIIFAFYDLKNLRLDRLFSPR